MPQRTGAYGHSLSGAASDSPLHFTGQPRGPETDLDNFGARYNDSTLGRPRHAGICGFLTPDWSAQAEPVPYAKLDNPQSLNLYSYVLNNPVTSVDPDGHWPNLDDVADFVAAFGNAYSSDNLLGAGRQDQSTDAGGIGAGFGDAAATLQGAAEALAGAGTEATGLALDATGARAVVGVPANAAGAAMMAHGSATTAIAIVHLAKGDPDRSGAQDRRLSDSEIKNLEKNTGRTAHEIKQDTVGRTSLSKHDLFKTPGGDIVVKPKDSAAEGNPTGYTVGDCRPKPNGGCS